MKQYTLHFFSFLVILGLTACKGAQGDVGPAGTNGTDGNANVVYTEWKTPTWDATIGSSSSATYIAQTNTASSVLTQDAIDKAAIFVYFKTKDLTRSTSLGSYQLVDRISTDLGSGYFKIPGRTTNLESDYASIVAGDFSSFGDTYHMSFGVNYFQLIAGIQATAYDGSTISEFTNASYNFYTAAGNALQYRIVVVYGSTKSARYASVNWKDYAEVKEVLKLKD